MNRICIDKPVVPPRKSAAYSAETGNFFGNEVPKSVRGLQIGLVVVFSALMISAVKSKPISSPLATKVQAAKVVNDVQVAQSVRALNGHADGR